MGCCNISWASLPSTEFSLSLFLLLQLHFHLSCRTYTRRNLFVGDEWSIIPDGRSSAVILFTWFRARLDHCSACPVQMSKVSGVSGIQGQSTLIKSSTIIIIVESLLTWWRPPFISTHRLILAATFYLTKLGEQSFRCVCEELHQQLTGSLHHSLHSIISELS